MSVVVLLQIIEWFGVRVSIIVYLDDGEFGLISGLYINQRIGLFDSMLRRSLRLPGVLIESSPQVVFRQFDL